MDYGFANEEISKFITPRQVSTGTKNFIEAHDKTRGALSATSQFSAAAGVAGGGALLLGTNKGKEFSRKSNKKLRLLRNKEAINKKDDWVNPGVTRRSKEAHKQAHNAAMGWQKQKGVEAREALLNQKNAVPKSKFIQPSQVSHIGTGAALTGGSVLALMHRNKQRKSGEKPKGGKAVDVGIGAGGGFVAASTIDNAQGWAMKRGSDAYRDKHKTPEAEKRFNEYKKERGVKRLGHFTPGDKLDTSTREGQLSWGKHYPKEIPGGSVKRLMARTGSSKVIGPVLGGSAVAGAFLANSRANKASSKGRSK